MAEDYSISAYNRLRARVIAGKFQKDLDVNTLVIEKPVPWSSLEGNTQVQIRVLDAYGERNDLAMNYYRTPLASVIPPDSVVTEVGATQSHDLLPALLTDYGIHLDPNDIVNEPLTGSPYQLTASPDSLGFTGSVQIKLGDTGDLGFTLIRSADERLIMVGNRYLRRV